MITNEDELLHLKRQLEQERNRRLDTLEEKLERLQKLLNEYQNDVSKQNTIEGETLAKLRLMISDCQSHISAFKERQTLVEKQATAIGEKLDDVTSGIPVRDNQIDTMNDMLVTLRKKVGAIEEQMPILNHFKDRLNLVLKSLLSFFVMALLGVIVWAIKMGADVM